MITGDNDTIRRLVRENKNLRKKVQEWMEKALRYQSENQRLRERNHKLERGER